MEVVSSYKLPERTPADGASIQQENSMDSVHATPIQEPVQEPVVQVQVQEPVHLQETEHIELVANSDSGEPKSPKSPKGVFSAKHIKKINLSWENLRIDAKTRKKRIVNGKQKAFMETKTIINNISGSVRNGRFTAIMGPSGSGKTTLLNFLSARISGKNLTISGKIKANGHLVGNLDKIADTLAYVMQDDILLATITPREAFMFTANLRLKISHEEKKKKVEALLADLGLKHVASTKIGNNLIRGISGGERKRTSIGFELITDPSMIFLDEPTTGLDSKTSENVINLLVNLAQKGGRTVVSTIHQPSSEVFSLFDELILVVRGNIIYQGKAENAVTYFSSIGFQCPKLTNPADYFMKIINESGIMLEMMEKDQGRAASKAALQMSQDEIESRFLERLNHFNECYTKSGMAQKALEGLDGDKVSTKDHPKVNWFLQFWYIFVRKLQDEIRNPMEMKVKIAQKLIFSAIIMLAFNRLGNEGEAAIQNRNGVLFFYASMAFMAGVQGSIGTFSSERPIFLRERASKNYDTSAYYWARAAAEIPLLVIQPVLLVMPSYYVIGLHNPAYKYFVMTAIQICSTFAGAGYGLIISTFVSSMELAVSIAPIILVPMMLFAGYFVSQDKVPYFFYEFLYISPIKYAFQASVQIEFRNHDICGPGNAGCDPLETLGNYQGIGLSIGIILILALGLRIIAYYGLVLVSTPKKPKMLALTDATSTNPGSPRPGSPRRSQVASAE